MRTSCSWSRCDNRPTIVFISLHLVRCNVWSSHMLCAMKIFWRLINDHIRWFRNEISINICWFPIFYWIIRNWYIRIRISMVRECLNWVRQLLVKAPYCSRSSALRIKNELQKVFDQKNNIVGKI